MGEGSVMTETPKSGRVQTATAKLYGLKATGALRILKGVEEAVRSWRVQAKAHGLPRSEIELMAAAFRASSATTIG